VEKARALAAADVLLIPSRCDGAPTVIAEAALAGVPMIATRVGGIPELVAPDEAEMCLPEPSSIRDALERLRCDRPRREVLARRARARAGERTWQALGPLLAGQMADRLPGGHGFIHVDRV
jgi:glycosyltransferase involved in cell wall biosynthesis